MKIDSRTLQKEVEMEIVLLFIIVSGAGITILIEAMFRERTIPQR